MFERFSPLAAAGAGLFLACLGRRHPRYMVAGAAMSRAWQRCASLMPETWRGPA
jgi:hypothetical protein